MSNIIERDIDNINDIYEDEEDSMENKFLTFNISDESYGINIQCVVEIIELQKITEVPDMPDFIKGVINLRGKIIPVMDLRLRFHLEERGYDDRTCIIVTNIKDTNVGFIVDTVDEVVEILENNIEPPPKFKSDRIKEQYISGLGKIDSSVKIILDVEKVLYEEEILNLKNISKDTLPADGGLL